MGEAILARASSGGGGKKSADYVFEFYVDSSYYYLYCKFVSTTTANTTVWYTILSSLAEGWMDAGDGQWDSLHTSSNSADRGVVLTVGQPSATTKTLELPIWVFTQTTAGYTAQVQWFDGAEWHLVNVYDEGYTSSSNPLVVEVADTGLTV